MASTNPFLTLYSTVQTNLVGSTIATGYIPYISTAGRQNYSNTLSTLTVSTISGAVKAPTVQIFSTIGTGSYSTITGCARLKVKMCGGGGSGGVLGSSTNGNPGASTMFGSCTALAGGGGYCAGLSNGIGGSGGNGGTDGTYTRIVRIVGGTGLPGTAVTNANGGAGGGNPFGGGGPGGQYFNNNTGADGRTNTGTGGGACSGNNVSGSGGGGGAGEYVEFYVTSPSGVIPYKVGSGGSYVTSGGAAISGSGASGIIVVEEQYI